jgi:DNA polymerase III epsilon subunit-like protein
MIVRHSLSRRELLRRLGVGSAVLPFLGNLPSLALANTAGPKKRLVIVFSPDGVVKKNFWPTIPGPFLTPGPVRVPAELPPCLAPLEPFRDRLLTLKGVHNKVKGDGDLHMRGMGCLLTGIELLPGNIQGGGETPAGWSSGISIDQEIRNHLQSRPETTTRFGSLEFGVLVPNRADTWSRMVYAGGNKPVAPIDDPYQMFKKLYGQMKDRESMKSVLDELHEDLAKVALALPPEDRRILEEHTALVRHFEKELSTHQATVSHAVPVLEQGILEQNDHMPKISRMQIELVVSSLAADFTRVATLQYTQSVGSARFKWLDIDEGQHALSHEPNKNEVAQEKLTKINAWYAGEVAHLAKRLAETPEPGGSGSLLDHTTILWTNELGEGNSHSHADIPWALVGNGLGFTMGRAAEYPGVPHNRLLIALAHAMGHTELARFGNPDYCGDGPLSGLA